MQQYTPTNFEKYATKDFVNNTTIQYSIWDTSGSAAYDTIRPLAYPDANAFILCFKISEPDSFHAAINKVNINAQSDRITLYRHVDRFGDRRRSLQGVFANGISSYTFQWLPEIRTHCPTTPVVFCGCASDLRNDVETIARLSQSNYGEPIAREYATRTSELIRTIGYVETSSKYGDDKGLYEVFALAAKAALAQLTINTIYENAIADAKNSSSTNHLATKNKHNSLNCMRLGFGSIGSTNSSNRKKELKRQQQQQQQQIIDAEMYIYHGMMASNCQISNATGPPNGKTEFKSELKHRAKNCTIM